MRRIALLAATLIPAGLLLTSGSALAGQDNRCQDPDGVAVVCAGDDLVSIPDLDVDILRGHHHH